MAARAEDTVDFVSGCGEIAVAAEAASAAVVCEAFCALDSETCVAELSELLSPSMFIIIIMVIMSLEELLSPNPLRPLIPYAESILAMDDEEESESVKLPIEPVWLCMTPESICVNRLLSTPDEELEEELPIMLESAVAMRSELPIEETDIYVSFLVKPRYRGRAGGSPA